LQGALSGQSTIVVSTRFYDLPLCAPSLIVTPYFPYSGVWAKFKSFMGQSLAKREEKNNAAHYAIDSNRAVSLAQYAKG
jgi:hypothetical protein